MKKSLLFLLLAVSSSLYSQTFDFNYDHYSFVVEDLQKTGDFYAEILGLKEIPHPEAKKGFRWFQIKENSQLHLIQKKKVDKTENKSVHLCLAISDLPGFIAHLDKTATTYWDWPGNEQSITLRADGVQQIYIKDPEANWIEINTAIHGE